MQDVGDNSAESPKLRHLLALGVVVLAAIHLYCPPARVAELEVIPDSVEYAVAAHQFATTGHYQIRVNGRTLPPRYPPGFSVLFLAPIYAIAPGEIGNGIFAVWLCGILAALFAYLIGSRLAGAWGGTLAAVLLLHHQPFVGYTQVIMTDVPAVALGLIACWIYMRIQDHPSTGGYAAAGCIVALSISIRPLSGVLILPFVFDVFWNRRPGKLLKLALLGLPALLVIAGTSWQQYQAFGDWRRTGYQFWLPVPYDYFPLTFSTRYLRDNLHMFQWAMIWAPALAGLIGFIAIARTRHPQAARIGGFLIAGALPLSVAHLFYFFTDIRFHFLGLALLCVLAGAGIAALIPARVRRAAAFVPALLLMSILLLQIAPHPREEGKPVRRLVATIADQMLPRDALLISAIDPAYLEYLYVHGTDRRVLPMGRKVPYASTVLAAKRILILIPPPRNAADQSCAGLLKGGAEPLYAFTADEAVGQLKEWIRGGRRVYVDTLSAASDDPGLSTLRAAFRLIPVSTDTPWLVRIEIR